MATRLVIGTDEAGYGPKLGPLVIGATAFIIHDSDSDLRDLLSDAVCQTASQATCAANSLIEVADSKCLFGKNKSLARLERGVLAFALSARPTTERTLDRRLLNQLVPPTDEPIAEFFQPAQFPVPGCLSHREIGVVRQRLQQALRSRRVEFLGFATRCLFPQRFNQLVLDHHNKASLLTFQTLQLVCEITANLPHPARQSANILVQCDKHGGRSKYASWLQHALTSQLVQVRHESRQSSLYAWTNEQNQNCQIQFMARGEQELPIALASMAAKYLRERYMANWNQFWGRHVANLKPTAGYPVDATRFQRQIRTKQLELQISDNEIWRCR